MEGAALQEVAARRGRAREARLQLLHRRLQTCRQRIGLSLHKNIFLSYIEESSSAGETLLLREVAPSSERVQHEVWLPELLGRSVVLRGRRDEAVQHSTSPAGKVSLVEDLWFEVGRVGRRLVKLPLQELLLLLLLLLLLDALVARERLRRGTSPKGRRRHSQLKDLLIANHIQYSGQVSCLVALVPGQPDGGESGEVFDGVGTGRAVGEARGDVLGHHLTVLVGTVVEICWSRRGGKIAVRVIATETQLTWIRRGPLVSFLLEDVVVVVESSLPSCAAVPPVLPRRLLSAGSGTDLSALLLLLLVGRESVGAVPVGRGWRSTASKVPDIERSKREIEDKQLLLFSYRTYLGGW